MACKNTPCKYHDARSENGCNLFPGRSWTNCRGASVKPVSANKPTPKTNSKKEHK